MQDLDFYSSTVSALRSLRRAKNTTCPCVLLFRRYIGSEVELYNDFTGERLAINEFNQSHKDIKLGLPYHLLDEKLSSPGTTKYGSVTSSSTADTTSSSAE